MGLLESLKKLFTGSKSNTEQVQARPEEQSMGQAGWQAVGEQAPEAQSPAPAEEGTEGAAEAAQSPQWPAEKHQDRQQ